MKDNYYDEEDVRQQKPVPQSKRHKRWRLSNESDLYDMQKSDSNQERSI